eukprot:scaffold7904_cov117-Skeletonema_dohrnii-CCMP3373.AAC.2
MRCNFKKQKNDAKSVSSGTHRSRKPGFRSLRRTARHFTGLRRDTLGQTRGKARAAPKKIRFGDWKIEIGQCCSGR